MVVLGIVFLTFASIVTMGVGIGKMASRGEQAISQRLSRLNDGLTANIRQVELNKPLSERLFLPLFRRIASQTAKNLPAERRQRLQKALQRAGNPGNMGPAEFLAIKAVLTVVLPFITGAVTINSGWEWRSFTGVGLAMLVGWYGPDLYLKTETAKRQAIISKSLPDVLDLLTVSIEAGLGFDAALSKVVEKDSGPLALEFRRALQEVMVGKPRREALRDVAQRIDIEEFYTFINAVVQADQLGLGIVNVLRNQSDQIRVRRRQRIEEQAMKAPVKMLFPLVFFIFPAIFIILLGPALIQIMEVMRNK